MKSLVFTLAVVFMYVRAFSQVNGTNEKDSIMITVFLRHQQDKNLDSLQKIQQKNKFLERFPPPFARVVSWYVMMGIGQVVTVKIPAANLRALNLTLEQGAWGAFNTEFYPTYDYVPVWKEAVKQKK